MRLVALIEVIVDGDEAKALEILKSTPSLAKRVQQPNNSRRGSEAPSTKPI